MKSSTQVSLVHAMTSPGRSESERAIRKVFAEGWLVLHMLSVVYKIGSGDMWESRSIVNPTMRNFQSIPRTARLYTIYYIIRGRASCCTRRSINHF
ncbi:uncharacterized protein L3040_002459 [Drepanopeziza brunnea f. sp. 'multigermtubi']|uniref:uncharacterized protein n=1 Tax=Drepanopeziza brunnea f. sp. 'multigermtubi' TaxID=698441 RepID=UPI00238BC449|nr:hypothetical protein L3040_002459 [Drepanopeziza brunnea f. sp. 'multigermtubi']